MQPYHLQHAFIALCCLVSVTKVQITNLKLIAIEFINTLHLYIYEENTLQSLTKVSFSLACAMMEI